jgi:UPF0716 protein FxsA
MLLKQANPRKQAEIMPILILFLLVPVVEIWLFVKVGEVIGAWPTVGLVVVMAVAGAALVRIQGLAVLDRARATLAAGEFPTSELLDGLFVLLAGFLLIMPGFLTDVIGILLFIPALRRRLGASIWGWISHRPNIILHRGGRVMEGTYHEVDPGDAPPDRPSGPPPGRLDHSNRR